MRTETGTTVRLADYAPAPYRAPEVMLMVSLHPHATVVRNTTHYEPRGAGAGPLSLDGDGLNLTGVELDGVALGDGDYDATPDSFVLKAPPDRAFVLTLTTVIAPEDNTELMGLYRSGGVYCTQCEAEGFRRITYAYDRPDVLSVYDVWILSDGPDPVPLLSNGNLVGEGLIDGKPWAQWHDPFPKPTYLFALVAGPLGVVRDSFTTVSGRRVGLAIYVEPGKESRAAFAMEALKASMAWDETRFGREYDLDVFNIVTVSTFNMGAMENKGLNVFNDRYVLADPDIATDSDYGNIEAVIAHEYFHNWTGNRITCRDWFQLCLKEGLTVYRDQEFTSDMRSRGVKRVEDAKRLRSAQFREDASPLRHPVRPDAYDEISNLYTATVYEKGAELVRMIATLVGEKAFREGMDRYFLAEDGNAATVEDFLKAFTTLDREAFMPWYQEPGTPTVKVVETFGDGTLTVELHQLPAEGASVKPIPVRVALLGKDGPLDLGGAKVADGTLRDDVLVLDGRTARITVSDLHEKPVVSVLRGFSAPVRLDREDDAERDAALLARESDPFAAWDAAQRLQMRALKAFYRDGEADTDDLAGALREAVEKETQEPALRALLLGVPPMSGLVEALGSDVDADKVLNAHRALQAALGEKLGPTLRALRAGDGPDPADAGADAAGERSLRSAALSLLVAAGDAGLAVEAAGKARNMTERLSALGALTAAGAPAADDALKTFHDAHAGEPLVLDKYFILQALRTDGEPLERVRGLMNHQGFSLANPNRTRSLIGAFAQNVPVFHAADGSGYAFLTEIVGKLDGENAQLAARLLTAFADAVRFDEPRREASRSALLTLREEAKSSDVRDILNRLLASMKAAGG